MPQLVAPLIVATKIIAANAILSAIATSVASAALTYGLGKLNKPKTPQAAPDQGLELFKRIRTDHPIEVLFGETATPGSLMWWGVRGTDNEFLEQVLCLSDYTCDSIQKVYGDGEELTFSSSLTSGYAPCTSHYLDEDDNPCLWVKVYLGDPDQTADADLVANYSEITTNFRGRGRAYAITRMKWNRDAFPAGEPNLLFVMRGASVYDPRLDSTVTGGSGTHRSDDPTTWEWSANNALIGAQYLQGWSQNGALTLGMGYSRDRIPAADVIAAANECDESVNLNAGGSENRYECHGSFLVGKSGRAHQANMELILAACDGEFDDGNGREFRIIPGVERTPVSLTVAWDDIVSTGRIQLEPDAEPAERINSILGQFTDPAANYELGDVPLRQVAAYVAEDAGQEYFDEPTILAATSYTQVQRIFKRRLERARAEKRVSLVLPLTYARLEKGDRVNFDATLRARLRLPDTVWSVEQRPTITADLKCEIVFRERPDTIGDWTPATDELSRTTTSVTGATLASLALTGVTATVVSLTQGGSTTPAIRVSWTASDARVNVAVLLTRLDGASPPSPASPLEVLSGGATGADGSVDIPVVSGAQYKVQYRILFNGRVTGLTTVEAALTAGAVVVPVGDISGLGDLAVEDTVDLGSGRIRDSGGTPIGDSAVLNTAVSIGVDGVLAGAGGGSVTLDGLGAGTLASLGFVTLGSNVRAADGTTTLGDSDLRNSAISIGVDGVLAGAGGGSVTLDGLGAGTLASLGFVTLGSNVRAADGTTTLGDSDLRNSAITVDGSGVLSGIGTASIVVNNAALVAGDIPNLPATILTSGTLPDARIQSTGVTQHQSSLALAGSQITSGTLDVSRVPTLTLSKISDAGTLAGKSTIDSAGLLSDGVVSTDKLANNSVDDDKVAANRAFVQEGAGVPTATARRIYNDTTNDVIWYDDGTNIRRISRQVLQDNLGTDTGVSGTAYEVVVAVEVPGLKELDILSIQNITINFQSPDEATSEAVVGEWAIGIVDASRAPGDAWIGTGTENIIADGRTITFQLDGANVVLNSDGSSGLILDVGAYRIPVAYEGTCHVCLLLKLTAATTDQILLAGTGTQMSVLISP